MMAAAISPPPQLFAYWAPPEAGERIARAVNDGLAEMRRACPDRFLPLASLPLQHGVRAARELERACVELGLRGAALCTHVNGVDLDLAENAMRGTWSVGIYTDPKKEPVTTQMFLVEDFVPDRIEFDLTADKKEIGPGELANVTVDVVSGPKPGRGFIVQLRR